MRFFMPFMEYISTLTMVNPNNMEESPINFLAFVKILSSSAWALFFAACATLVLGYLIIYVSEEEEEGEGLSSGKQGFLQGVGFVFRTILQVDGTFFDKRISSKLFFLTMAVFSHIFFAYYNAILTSFMTVRAPAPGFFSKMTLGISKERAFLKIEEKSLSPRHNTDFCDIPQPDKSPFPLIARFLLTFSTQASKHTRMSLTWDTRSSWSKTPPVRTTSALHRPAVSRTTSSRHW